MGSRDRSKTSPAPGRGGGEQGRRERTEMTRKRREEMGCRRRRREEGKEWGGRGGRE